MKNKLRKRERLVETDRRENERATDGRSDRTGPAAGLVQRRTAPRAGGIAHVPLDVALSACGMIFPRLL